MLLNSLNNLNESKISSSNSKKIKLKSISKIHSEQNLLENLKEENGFKIFKAIK